MDLSDISLESVNDILSSLSDKDMENLTKLASDFFAGNKAQESKEDNEKKKEKSGGMPFEFDMDVIMKIASVMNRLSNQPEDPRCRLLRDLQPMLSRERRQKVETAIQILKMVSLMPLLKELN